MKFKELKLYTNKIELEFNFYSKILGFELVDYNTNSFTVKIGWSKLTFKKSEKEHLYHYCFLIPSNKLSEALEWMEKRTEVIEIESGRKTQNFESWNADSFYFYDGSGNIAEFIVRYDLYNEDSNGFNANTVLGINEIGMPTNNIEKINDQLQNEIGTVFWKGDVERFGTNGDQEGIFLLPNHEVKDTWFPTNSKITLEPFEAIIENDEKEYSVEYRKGEVTTAIIKG